jgi:hypothetical protein
LAQNDPYVTNINKCTRYQGSSKVTKKQQNSLIRRQKTDEQDLTAITTLCENVKYGEMHQNVLTLQLKNTAIHEQKYTQLKAWQTTVSTTIKIKMSG